MTDQNQFKDPQQNHKQDPQNSQNNDVFGGSDDIFENSEILEPIKGDNEKSDEIKVENQNDHIHSDHTDNLDTPEIVDSTTIEDSHNDNSNEDVQNDDFFDPFNDDHLDTQNNEKNQDDVFETVEADNLEVEKADFDDNSAIDALDNIDELESVDQLDDLSDADTDIKNIEEIENESTNVPEQEDMEEKNKEKGNTKEMDNITRDNDMSENETPVEDIKTTPKQDDIKEEVHGNDNINIDSTIAKIESKVQANKNKNEEKGENKHNTNNDIEDSRLDEDIEEKKDEKIGNETISRDDNDTDLDQAETNPLKTDLQNKFDELLGACKTFYDLIEKKQSDEFELIGGNDDRTKITYKVSLDDDKIKIHKLELNKLENTSDEYKLEFLVDKSSLNVRINDELLYDEVNDLQENQNKKMQVIEKLNKFIFLVNEEYKKLEKEKKQQEKKKRLKGIFRNFMF